MEQGLTPAPFSQRAAKIFFKKGLTKPYYCDNIINCTILPGKSVFSKKRGKNGKFSLRQLYHFCIFFRWRKAGLYNIKVLMMVFVKI
jgi:hypothetical protein